MKLKQIVLFTRLSQLRFMSWKLLSILGSIAVYLIFAAGALYANSSTVETILGNLADGTPYTVHKPASWNGTIVLDLDGAMVKNEMLSWMTANGYAIGGTTRDIAGYNFRQAVDNLVAVRSIFAEKSGMPTRTLTIGGPGVDLYPGWPWNLNRVFLMAHW